MPRLFAPLAVVGAAAGWLSAEVLDNPIAGVTPSHAGGVAAAAAAVMGALGGAILQRWCAPRAWTSAGATWMQVAVVVLGGGAASGAVTGGVAFASGQGATSGLLAGLGVGLVFLPVCALVVAMARRAARARVGSLVASADRREVWAVTAAALAVMTAAALPDVMAGERPLVAWAIGCGAVLATLALLAGDALAWAAVWRLAREAERMDLREGPAGEAEGALPTIDLGLGHEVRARMARSAAAYRGQDRAAALLVGSFAEARAALRWGVARKALACLVAAAALGGHALALSAPPRGRVVYHEMLCRRGHPLDCGIASAMRREGEPDDMPRAAALAAAACECEGGDVARCIRAVLEAPPESPDRAVLLRYHERACFGGDAASCRSGAEIAAADEGGSWTTAALLQRACEADDMKSCVDAAHARDAAGRREGQE